MWENSSACRIHFATVQSKESAGTRLASVSQIDVPEATAQVDEEGRVMSDDYSDDFENEADMRQLAVGSAAQ